MNFRNIDLMNSLIPVCDEINKFECKGECECSQCSSQSSEHELYDDAHAESIFLRLAEVCVLLEKLSPEYIERFAYYEIDFEDLIDSIAYIVSTSKEFSTDFELIHEHIAELQEMCESEVVHYLLMAHPIDHNNLKLLTIQWDGGDDFEPRIICRTSAQGAGSKL